MCGIKGSSRKEKREKESPQKPGGMGWQLSYTESQGIKVRWAEGSGVKWLSLVLLNHQVISRFWSILGFFDKKINFIFNKAQEVISLTSFYKKICFLFYVYSVSCAFVSVLHVCKYMYYVFVCLPQSPEEDVTEGDKLLLVCWELNSVLCSSSKCS